MFYLLASMKRKRTLSLILYQSKSHQMCMRGSSSYKPDCLTCSRPLATNHVRNLNHELTPTQPLGLLLQLAPLLHKTM